MSVYRLNGRFYMKGRLYQDDGSFKYYNKAIKGCTSIAAARKAEEVFLLQQRDLIIGRDTFTFREVCDAYLKSIRHLKKSGIKLKSDRLNRTCRVLGDKKIGLNDSKEEGIDAMFHLIQYYAVNGRNTPLLLRQVWAEEPRTDEIIDIWREVHARTV